MTGWLIAAAMAQPQAPSPSEGGAEAEVVIAPLREDDHPRYLDAANHVLRYPRVRELARHTDVMPRIRRRRAGRTTLRVLFTGATVAEAWGTAQLVNQGSTWAWVLGAQTGFTALAAGLLWADIPRSRRIDRAEVLDAANAYVRTAPTPPLVDAR